ncbi:3-oxoadipate enol-lactonase [Flavobacterium granuli]|uniref:3-oxoadipate enol-lactonase n=1 Tax=Flavobacterium granuli TaxID=280093 RepID=A0A1M5S0T1_9FLAO|nr:3-oxoadipate enol-lactonase [Flavobacterium granuli]PRZ21174.1 3-oxoadipate enol-lactonase [Flavobacterium granuli]SHH32252.1 3-oxoadipate enol-lactonase [Flavobacterium granuli]
MSKIKLQHTTLNYVFDDFKKEQTILFSNSLGTDLTMWDKQVELLGAEFNILRYDTRGHGKSEVPAGEYSIEMLGKDVLDLLDYLKIQKVNFCGLSIGGLTGQWLGIHAPERLNKLILCNTAVKIGNAEGWNSRIEAVQKNGLDSIVSGTQERWFTPEFVAENKDEVDAVLVKFVQTPLAGYISCCAAVRDADFTAEVSKISVPTLIISGTEDAVTTIKDGGFLMGKIPNSLLAALKTAHISNIEKADDFTKLLIEFIKN